MTDNVAHFSSSNSVEHHSNGVITGLFHVQEIDLIEKNIDTWIEKDRVDCSMIRALLMLAKQSKGDTQDGFMAWDIVKSMTFIRKRPWSTDGDKERMSDDVRKSWKKAEILWQSKLEGIKQSLLDRGFQYYPKFSRVEGGGTGNLTKYYVSWEVILKQAADCVLTFIDIPQVVSTNVKYICEDITDASYVDKIFTNGILLKGWRRTLYSAFIIFPLALFLVCIFFLIFNLAFTESLQKYQLVALLKTILGLFVVFVSIYPMLNAKEMGIILAPWWMQSTENERLLEFRKPPRYLEKSIKVVKYTTSCPICGGKVFVKSGGFEFWRRLVGRCEESPMEHVYSFDYITRQGRWLRA